MELSANRLPLVFCVALVMLTPQNAAGDKAGKGHAEFGACYADWGPGVLTVGNKLFEANWRGHGSWISLASFRLKSPESDWLKESSGESVDELLPLEVEAQVEKATPLGAEGLRIDLSVGSPERTRSLRVFPGVAAILIEGRGDSGGPLEDFTRLRLAKRHLRVVEVELRDQTDQHNELVHEREWLISPNDRTISLRGSTAYVENALDGEGLSFVKLAPLPHARAETGGADFTVDCENQVFEFIADDYPLAILAHRGGRYGRIAALHTLQRRLRAYSPERDGQFVSNTWGDRSRDTRINEAFLLREIEAAERLGVDVLQVDDGWQTGRTKNSADVEAQRRGVWNGFWAQNPDFWKPDPSRFPNGLEPLVKEARSRGIRFGLWYAPDSSNEMSHWGRDADRLLELHHETGIDFFKIDAVKMTSPQALAKQQRLFGRLFSESGGKIEIDLDVTAEVRPGYFAVPEAVLFVENRYTDWTNYWPHHTLRNLWELSQYVDPLRLRMELLNNGRNTGNYRSDDPLAPARYRPDTLFAITMMANPLGWFEVSNLPEEYFADVAPLVQRWKEERAAMHGGVTFPVGSPPDGVSWTGFVSRASEEEGYVLLFRELNASSTFALDLGTLIPRATAATPIGGRGTALFEGEQLTVKVPEELGFVWVRLSGD